jgi:hypothetical protein
MNIPSKTVLLCASAFFPLLAMQKEEKENNQNSTITRPLSPTTMWMNNFFSHVPDLDAITTYNSPTEFSGTPINAIQSDNAIPHDNINPDHILNCIIAPFKNSLFEKLINSSDFKNGLKQVITQKVQDNQINERNKELYISNTIEQLMPNLYKKVFKEQTQILQYQSSQIMIKNQIQRMQQTHPDEQQVLEKCQQAIKIQISEGAMEYDSIQSMIQLLQDIQFTQQFLHETSSEMINIIPGLLIWLDRFSHERTIKHEKELPMNLQVLSQTLPNNTVVYDNNQSPVEKKPNLGHNNSNRPKRHLRKCHDSNRKKKWQKYSRSDSDSYDDE